MEIVLGILLLLALCGSRAAKNGLTLLIGVPLGLVAAVMLMGMLMAGVSAVTMPRGAPAVQPARAAVPQSAAAQEVDDAYVAGVRLHELRARYGTTALP